MELQIKLANKNTYPIGGFLVKSPLVADWLKQIELLDLKLEDIQTFAIPDITPNSVWGCFVICNDFDINKIGKNQLCQKVITNLYIPEKAVLFPTLNIAEIDALFEKGKHIIHPEFGLVALSEKVHWKEIITISNQEKLPVIKPSASVYVPNTIKSFQLKPVSTEELLKQMEEKMFPKKQKMPDEKLNLLEHLKLMGLKTLFNSVKDGDAKTIEKSSLLTGIETILGKLLPNSNNQVIDNLQQDFEELEKRNQAAIDKFLEMLKNNPDEALKYAIPLDENGSSRGNFGQGEFNLSMRWMSLLFSDSGNDSSSYGGSIDLGDKYFELQRQYNQTAEKLIAQKEYQKAAFVYFKLLKNSYKAAETLEKGGFYSEAAAIFLKNNFKEDAAKCFEKGRMTDEAIKIYKELNKNEKVGDLYASINNTKEANIYYNLVANNYISNNQFVKASVIYKNKIHDASLGQQTLLKGWQSNLDASNCLNTYLSNITDVKQVEQEINRIFKTEITRQNREQFLTVIQTHFEKDYPFKENLKEIGYQLIAEQIPFNKGIVGELKVFNQTDKELMKDTIRFKVNNK